MKYFTTRNAAEEYARMQARGLHATHYILQKRWSDGWWVTSQEPVDGVFSNVTAIQPVGTCRVTVPAESLPHFDARDF